MGGGGASMGEVWIFSETTKWKNKMNRPFTDEMATSLWDAQGED